MGKARPAFSPLQLVEIAGEISTDRGMAWLMKKLMNWSKERGQDPAHPDTSAIMEPIAHGLTEPQIAAVAAYLNYLE
jgi:cytochrome c553